MNSSPLQLRPQLVEEVLHDHERGRPCHVRPTIVSHHEKPLIIRRDRKRAPNQRSGTDSVGYREQDAGRFRRKGRTRIDPHFVHLPAGDVEQLAPVVRPERSTATARSRLATCRRSHPETGGRTPHSRPARSTRTPANGNPATAPRPSRRIPSPLSRAPGCPLPGAPRECPPVPKPLLTWLRRARSTGRQDSRTRQSDHLSPRGAWVRRCRQRPAPRR